MSYTKKILITLGCSYVEGIGCYDNQLMNKYQIKDYNFLPREELDMQLYKFHRDGFPNKLGKLMNYDKVINLGLGGSGSSGQLKRFIEKLDSVDFNDSEVLLFWYLSEPSRYSFYIQGEVRDQQMGLPIIYQMDFDKHFMTLMDMESDTFKEQVFYVKLMNYICKSKGWKYLVSHSQKSFQEKLEIELSGVDYVLPFDGDYTMKVDKEHKALYCSHPNEEGYSIIAKRIYDKISKYKPELISETIPREFEWEWIGR